MKKRITSLFALLLCLFLVSCGTENPNQQESTEKSDISADISIPEENDVSDGNSETESEIPEVTDTRNDGFTITSSWDTSSVDSHSVTDGSFIYTLYSIYGSELCEQKIIIHSVKNGQTELVKEIILSDESWCVNLSLYGDRLVLARIKTLFYHVAEHSTDEAQLRFTDNETTLEFYEHDGKGSLDLVNSFSQSGTFKHISVENGRIYFITNYYFGYDYGDLNDMFWEDYPVLMPEDVKQYVKEKINSRLPAVGYGTAKTVSEDRIHTNDGAPLMDCFVFSVLEPESKTVSTICADNSCVSLFISGNNVYIRDHTRLSEEATSSQATMLSKFTVTDGVPEYVCSTCVNGSIGTIQEKNGYLRFISVDPIENDLFNCVIDMYAVTYDENLNEVGRLKIPDTTRSLKSVIFDDDTVYVMTFGSSRVVENTGMLYAIDLSDNENPVITSSVKINGYSQYLAFAANDKIFGLGHQTSGQKDRGIKLSIYDVLNEHTLREETSTAKDRTTSLINNEYMFINTDNKNVLIRYKTYIIDEASHLKYSCTFAMYSYKNGTFELLGEKTHQQKDYSEKYFMHALSVDGHYYIIDPNESGVSISCYTVDNFTFVSGIE